MGYYLLDISTSTYYMYKKLLPNLYTVCPRSSDPYYMVSYYTKWVTISWTYCSNLLYKMVHYFLET